MAELVSYYLKQAIKAKTDAEKISFFNENQQAFFLDPTSSEFEGACAEFGSKQQMNEEQFEAMQEMKWIELPDEFKIFAFDYCITGGYIYQQ